MATASKERIIGVLAIGLLGGVSSAFAQVASGLVEGRVICNNGNVPARGANVQLFSLARLLQHDSADPSDDGAMAMTDHAGAYSLPVKPGTYILDATMAGYADELELARHELDRSTPEEKQIILAALPQIIVRAGASVYQDLILRRAGAISGTVFVDAGGTVSDSVATATLMPSGLPGKEGAGLPLPFSRSGGIDDRGIYRIAGLPPGNYRVSVRVVERFFTAKMGGPQISTVVPQRTGLADLTVFAPEALSQSDAKLIKVTDGDEETNADITIPMRSLHSLAGTVTRGGEPVAGVSLVLEKDGERVNRTSDALSMSNGAFQFDLLPAGSYSVSARTYNGGKETSSLKISVQLSNSDVTDLALDLLTRAAMK